MRIVVGDNRTSSDFAPGPGRGGNGTKVWHIIGHEDIPANKIIILEEIFAMVYAKYNGACHIEGGASAAYGSDALVGVGGRASLLLQQLPDSAQIVALCDCNLPRAEAFKAKNNAAWPVYQDYRKLLGVAKKFPGKFVVLAGGATLNPMIQEAGQQNETDGPLRERFLAHDALHPLMWIRSPSSRSRPSNA